MGGNAELARLNDNITEEYLQSLDASSVTRRVRGLLMQLFSRHVSAEVADELWARRAEFLRGGRPRETRLVLVHIDPELGRPPGHGRLRHHDLRVGLQHPPQDLALFDEPIHVHPLQERVDVDLFHQLVDVDPLQESIDVDPLEDHI